MARPHAPRVRGRAADYDSASRKFVVPDVRLPAAIVWGAFCVAGLILAISAFRHATFEASALVFGLLIFFGSVIGLLSVARGYAITVTDQAIEFHRLWTRELLMSEITAVEISEPIQRTVQRRICLQFELVDGSTYLFKDFNGSTSESSESYQLVNDAMLLIRRRLRVAGGSRVSSSLSDPPSPRRALPPLDPPESRSYGDSGGLSS